MQEALKRRWEQVVIDASASLAADQEARDRFLSRLYGKYLPAAFKARTPEADLRVWSSLGYYLTTATTNRKPFALSVEEADAVVETVRRLLERLRTQGSVTAGLDERPGG